MVDDDWRHETARVTSSFDRVADLYRDEFADELSRKPFDRELLTRVAPRWAGRRPVLEVGAGPAHVAAYLAGLGVPVLASDTSVGQLREALVLDPTRPVMAADLARLPVGPGRLSGVVAFSCLIYGPVAHLNDVFAHWREALAPGGLVLLAVHAGEGTLHTDEWRGRTVDLTVVLRDPEDLVARLEASGLAVDECTVRPPYEDEHPTERCYVVARTAL